MRKERDQPEFAAVRPPGDRQRAGNIRSETFGVLERRPACVILSQDSSVLILENDVGVAKFGHGIVLCTVLHSRGFLVSYFILNVNIVFISVPYEPRSHEMVSDMIPLSE